MGHTFRRDLSMAQVIELAQASPGRVTVEDWGGLTASVGGEHPFVKRSDRADALFLAIPFLTAEPLGASQPQWNGKIIVDATNSFMLPNEAEVLAGRLSTEIVTDAFPGADVGWQAGLPTGLRGAGADLAEADATVGTSAGALVGALLSGGRDITDALTSLAGLGRASTPAAWRQAMKPS